MVFRVSSRMKRPFTSHGRQQYPTLSPAIRPWQHPIHSATTQTHPFHFQSTTINNRTPLRHKCLFPQIRCTLRLKQGTSMPRWAASSTPLQACTPWCLECTQYRHRFIISTRVLYPIHSILTCRISRGSFPIRTLQPVTRPTACHSPTIHLPIRLFHLNRLQTVSILRSGSVPTRRWPHNIPQHGCWTLPIQSRLIPRCKFRQPVWLVWVKNQTQEEASSQRCKRVLRSSHRHLCRAPSMWRV